MKNAIRRTTSLTLFAAVASAAVLSGRAQSATSSKEASTIQLPAIQKTGGMPLMEAIAKRHSSREFAPDSLSAELLGGVLWATAGYNRPEEKKRVAASTRNWQAVEVYAVLETGIYAYDAYFLECALRHRAPLISLDGLMVEKAKSLGIATLEV